MALLAHRGMTTFARDNSPEAVSAVAAANAMKAPLGIEVDIRRTVDGELLLVHDPVEGGLTVDQSFASELCDRLGDHAPMTLAAGLQMMSSLPLINLEIKEHGHTAEVVEHAIEHLERFSKPFSSIVISSICPEVVAEVKTVDERVLTGLVIDKSFENFDRFDATETLDALDLRQAPDYAAESAPILRMLDEVRADYLNPHWSDLCGELMVGVASRGKEFIPWTVNDERLVMELSLRPEVAHVITDFPHLVFPELKNLGAPITSAHATLLPANMTAGRNEH